MRRYSLSYFIGQSIKGLWRNGVMSLASITVLLSCLIVMGSFALLVMNINFNLEEIGNLNEIVVFIESDTSYNTDEQAKLAPELVPSDSAFEFLGWSLDPDAVTADYTAGATYTVKAENAVAGNITFYAVWGNKTAFTNYVVRYNASGLTIDGPLPTDSGIYNESSEVTLAAGLSARYSTIEFLGWSLTPGAETADYLPGTVYTLNPADSSGGVVTLYAVWSEMPVFSSYQIIYDSNRVTVESMPTDNDVRLADIENKIKSLDNVSGIEFVSKETALEEEKKKLADYPDLLSTLTEGENPYPDSFVITYSDNEKVSTLQYQLEHIDRIYKVRCRSDLAENIESLKNGIILVLLWFMIILFVVSIFVIINTVKLAVFSRRQEVAIMRYVGATKWFITLLFLFEGIIISLVSSGMAYFMQSYMYKYVQKMIISDLQMISPLPFNDMKWYILSGFIFIGILTGIIGSLISLRKYLSA